MTFDIVAKSNLTHVPKLLDGCLACDPQLSHFLFSRNPFVLLGDMLLLYSLNDLFKKHKQGFILKTDNLQWKGALRRRLKLDLRESKSKNIPMNKLTISWEVFKQKLDDYLHVGNVL